MSRRARAAWLFDTTDPTGAGAMALRRIATLRTSLHSTALTLAFGRRRPLADSGFDALKDAHSPAGAAELAGADLVVTTGIRALEHAARRVSPSTPVIHFVHSSATKTLVNEDFMANVTIARRVVVPVDVDAARFAHASGLPPDRVVALDDFTLAEQSPLSTARGKVVFSVGVMSTDTGVLDIAEGFRRALPDLPGWQLRLYGWGRARPMLNEFIDLHGLRSSMFVLGPRHDVMSEYLDAGVVVRVASDEACGLSVLEALTAGVPVLGSIGVPAVRRFVSDGVNGVVLHRTDPDSIAHALIDMSEDSVRSKLATGARDLPSGALTDNGRRDLLGLFDGALAAMDTA